MPGRAVGWEAPPPSSGELGGTNTIQTSDAVCTLSLRWHDSDDAVAASGDDDMTLCFPRARPLVVCWDNPQSADARGDNAVSLRGCPLPHLRGIALSPAGCEAPRGHTWKRETCARMAACTFAYSNLFVMPTNRLLIFDFVAGPGVWHLETKYSSVNVQ